MFNLQAQITLLGNLPLMLIGKKRKSNNPFAECKKSRSALLGSDPLQMNCVTQFRVYEAKSPRSLRGELLLSNNQTGKVPNNH